MFIASFFFFFYFFLSRSCYFSYWFVGFILFYLYFHRLSFNFLMSRPACASASVSPFLSVSVPLSVSVSVSVSLFLCLPLSLSVSVSLFLSLYLSLCLCLSLPVSLSLCLSLSLSFFFRTKLGKKYKLLRLPVIRSHNTKHILDICYYMCFFSNIYINKYKQVHTER